jgi:hypothetical protein
MPDLRVVVDLAIEGDDEAPVARQHRLPTRRRQVDDRKPAMNEGDSRIFIEPHPVVVGTAVGQAGVHGREQPSVASTVSDYSRYPAHCGLSQTDRRRLSPFGT